MGKLAVIIAALTLAGCSTAPQIEYMPQKVEIPVETPVTKVTLPPVPVLAISGITPQSSDGDLVAAWVASVYQLRADDQQLRTLLKPYAK